MNRRHFGSTVGIGEIGLALSKTAFPLADERQQIGITIDDFNLFGTSQEVAQKRNRALLNALSTHANLKAAAFPVGKHIDNELGESLVREWGEAGHMIGNHTYSHWFYPNHSFEEFSQDMLRVEPLIKDMSGFTKRFLFPALTESVLSAAPNIEPAGESIIWALAKETGKFANILRYPGEDGEYEKSKLDKLSL